MKQTTIKEPFTLSSKGLHTGLHITATFRPAPVNTGIELCRIDLPEKPCYQALAQYVGGTERGTVLENGDWKISTVEHALSALCAMGVTNCHIDLDAPEMPILDGSAQLFVEAIRRVGIAEQEAEAREWHVSEVIEYTAKNGSTYRIEPADEPQAEVEICFPGELLHDQTATLEHYADYPQELAYARTFCFVREIQPLLQMGLIKGGDLQNALVIYEQPISQEKMDAMTDLLCQPRLDASHLGYLQPLHFDNEPARHKLLDLIGDLSLTGVRIVGKVSALRPGHAANTEFAKYISEHYLR